MDDTVPRPGEWHPWYEDKRGIVTPWLESDDPRPLRLQVPPPRWVHLTADLADLEPVVVELRKRECYAGPAAYRDRLMDPGIVWYVACDQFGRWVAGLPREAPLPRGRQ